jgi:hypothetical protein
MPKTKSLTYNLDAVADFYDFNNHAYRRFVEQLKASRVNRAMRIYLALLTTIA